MNNVFVEVAPAVPLSPRRRQTYTYSLTLSTADKAALRYRLVQVPFGSQKVAGVIIAVTTVPPAYSVHPAQLLPAPPLPAPAVAFAEWLARTMQGGLGYTLRLFLPPGSPTPSTADQLTTRPSHIVHSLVQQALFVTPQQLAASTAELAASEATAGPVLVILPEKWLLPPFTAALHDVGTAAMPVHSDLSPRQLSSTWHHIAANRVPIVVGTQKALFMPYSKLSSIIMVEEYYPTHKLWDQYPRLSNWYGVKELAALHQARVAYVNTTPSLRLLNELEHRRLRQVGRLSRRREPSLITLPYTARRQKNELLPKVVVEKIWQWVKKGDRVAVLYNRRGTKELRRLFHIALPKKISWAWHDAESGNGPPPEAPLVIGTTALLPAIQSGQFTHCLWLMPEEAISYPDFRSRERAWYTLHRLQTGAKVHLVTRQPHRVKTALFVSITALYRQEKHDRRPRRYPPFADMVRLTCRARSRAAALSKAARLIKALAERAAARHATIRIRGPYLKLATSPAPAAHVLLLGELAELQPLYDGLPQDTVDLDPYQVLGS